MKHTGRKIVSSALWILVASTGFFATGCSSVTDYSIRSYQGPMPMADYEWIKSNKTYGKATAYRSPNSTTAR